MVSSEVAGAMVDALDDAVKARVFDEILSHSCSNPSVDHPGWNEYRVELCCLRLVVTARPVTTVTGSGMVPYNEGETFDDYLYTVFEVQGWEVES